MKLLIQFLVLALIYGGFYYVGYLSGTKKPPPYFDLIIDDGSYSVPMNPGQVFHMKFIEPYNELKIEMPD